MKRGLPTGPVLLVAAVILAIGLGVIISSFFREVLPRFTADMAPLLRAGVALFFVGAAYFLTALVLLYLKPAPSGDDARHAVDGVDTRISLSPRDPAMHVATSILILVGAAVLLTLSLTTIGATGDNGRTGGEDTMGTSEHDGGAGRLTSYASHGLMTDPGEPTC